MNTNKKQIKIIQNSLDTTLNLTHMYTKKGAIDIAMVRIFAKDILDDLATIDKLENDEELSWYEEMRIDCYKKFQEE